MNGVFKREGKRRTKGKKCGSQKKRCRMSVEVEDRIVPFELNGLRREIGPDFIRLITPYIYNFTTNAKARWLDRSILDVYTTEFGSFPKDYYESAIKQGRITVSGESVDTDYKIKSGDVLSHTVHRHEPAVALHISEPPYVDFLTEEGAIIAVDKPATLPIHPCGGYHQNSLIHILEQTFGKVYTIHRLDRLTSGLVLIAKDREAANEWAEAIRTGNNCKKYYLARVKGRFPDKVQGALPNLDKEASSEEVRAFLENRTDSATKFTYGYSCSPVKEGDFGIIRKELDVESKLLGRHESMWYHIFCPVRIAEHKNGVCESWPFDHLDQKTIDETAKSACTSFVSLGYDSQTDSSLVLCRPRTGRTHQIRLHLQKCQHPIANDPNYGGEMFFADRLGERIKDEALKLLDQLVAPGSRNEPDSGREDATCKNSDPATVSRDDSETITEYVKRTCKWCSKEHTSEDRSKLELLVRSSGIWLHALAYAKRSKEGRTEAYSTTLPVWAKSFIDLKSAVLRSYS